MIICDYIVPKGNHDMKALVKHIGKMYQTKHQQEVGMFIKKHPITLLPSDIVFFDDTQVLLFVGVTKFDDTPDHICYLTFLYDTKLYCTGVTIAYIEEQFFSRVIEIVAQ